MVFSTVLSRGLVCVLCFDRLFTVTDTLVLTNDDIPIELKYKKNREPHYNSSGIIVTCDIVRCVR